MKPISFFFAIIIAFNLISCKEKTEKTSQNDGYTGVLASRTRNNDSLINQRIEKIKETLKQPIPILLLENLDENSKLAQELAVKDSRFQKEIRDKKTQEPLFSEVFGVYPLRQSDIIPLTQNCKQSKCFRVELYNFALNLTLTATVDLNAQKVLAVTAIPSSQPDIPNHLNDLAKHIALSSEEVGQALGFQPQEKQALMSNTKTALNRTKCERSGHLCVAPTFVKDDRALWAIVDLTELALVGVRWTNVGRTGLAVTEKSLQNEVLTQKYCETNNALEKNGWKLNYMLTNSDGLKVSDVSFKGNPILSSAKLVDWHVNYSNTEGFGYSDAVGCPYFSQAAVVAAVEPQVTEREDGFSLVQKYYSEGYPTPCNYSYEQRFDFYNDGRFRIVVGSLGRGCGNDGTYRPVTRIAFAESQNNFAEWQNGAWKTWENEAWQQQKPETQYFSDGFQYRISNNANQGFYLQANKGQFGTQERGDNAFVYVSKNSSERDEGESELVTIGPCCNTDYKQGPEKFIEPNPEPIQNSQLVLWYVSQLKNDDTKGREYCWAESVAENGVYKVKEYPCYSGAMFVPINK